MILSHQEISILLCSYTGFVPFFRHKFPGLFQDLDWFFKGSKIHINPYTPKISMLILLTAFHTLHIIFYLSLTDFQNFPGPVAFFPGLSRCPGKCHNKVPGLSRFSRNRTNPVHMQFVSLSSNHALTGILEHYRLSMNMHVCSMRSVM